MAELTKTEIEKSEVTETDKPDEPEDRDSGEDPVDENEKTEIEGEDKNEVSVNPEKAKAEELEEQSGVVETANKPDETPT